MMACSSRQETTFLGETVSLHGAWVGDTWLGPRGGCYRMDATWLAPRGGCHVLDVMFSAGRGCAAAGGWWSVCGKLLKLRCSYRL